MNEELQKKDISTRQGRVKRDQIHSGKKGSDNRWKKRKGKESGKGYEKGKEIHEETP